MAEPQSAEAVLLVDDEPHILKLVGQRLAGAGYQVLTASDGAQGLRLARDAHPAVILLDLSMPALDGLQVLDRLKREPETRDISVIMLTASGTESQITDAIERGALCYLTKPFQPRELLAEVALAAQRHAAAHTRPLIDEAS
ncbi:MAG TPA: response regulator [bacterium]